MFFSKKHTITFKKPLPIVRNDLLSTNDLINVVQVSETKLEGLSKYSYGLRTEIVSTIHLKALTPSETVAEIKNTFDVITNISSILMFLALWGFAIYEITQGVDFLSFEVLIKLGFSLGVIALLKITLHYHDKRILKLYKSFVMNSIPNSSF
jgi:hypothetical protein